ncbi:MAG: histidine phosphatase family protein [Actinobacteria bacterium]|nr:histidine phosphatase family protein [Actinomycetota bacterium]
MSCRVYLIRHGETIWNSQMKLQGHADIPLSERGLRQAAALAERLASRRMAAIYCSDLGRAVETARQVAAPHSLEVIPLRDLREMNFGEWEGLTFREITEKYGDMAMKWWSAPLSIKVPGGEGLTELTARVVPAVRDIVERHSGDDSVAVVCHGGPVRCLVGTVLKMDLNNQWRIRQDNAALNILDFSDWDSGIVALLNDRSHLAEEFSTPFMVREKSRA